MDQPLFDAIFALCFAAEQDGYEAVAEGLELVLDIYLMEQRVVSGADLMFKSSRSEQARDVAVFREDLRVEPLTFRWSASHFPLAAVS